MNSDVCEVDLALEVTVHGPGECLVRVGWPGFAFASRVFGPNERLFKVGQVATDEEISAEKKAAKKSRALAAAKTRKEVKLCKVADQDRLRDAYLLLKKVSDSLNTYRSKLERLDATTWAYGGKGDIQLPASEFPETLSLFPVIGGMRLVPINIYRAVLEGAILGSEVNYKKALAMANSAYKKASSGCKKVVGTPDY